MLSADLAAARLVGVRRLVGAGADAVADRMRGLPGVAGVGDPRADTPVELGQARTGPAEGDRVVVDGRQLLEQLGVARLELARAEILRVVGPVAVGADPDLEQRRLALDDGPAVVAVNVLIPGPDQTSENGSASSTSPFQPVPSPWTKPCHSAAACAAVIPGRSTPWTCSIAAAAISFASRIRLDFLRGLDHPRLVEQRHRVDRVRERVEPGLRVRRRLADHPVGRLRAEGELESDPAVGGRRLAGQVERAEPRRPGVAGVVAAEEAHVLRPGGASRVLGGRLEADQHGLALAREDAGVVALHPPEVRQVEDVVRSADDERVQVVLDHQRAHPVELRVVARPAHRLNLTVLLDPGVGVPSCHP